MKNEMQSDLFNIQGIDRQNEAVVCVETPAG
jgi:hypothetical protein